MSASNKKQSSYNPLLIIIIIFLLLLVGFLTYSLRQLSLLQSMVNNTSESQYSTENPPEESLTQTADDTTVFTHPQARYSITFPSSWNPQFFKSPVGYARQPYQDFIIFSPDYETNPYENTSLSLQKNASILIRVSDTQYADIEEKFSDNLAAQKIARNIVRGDANGIPYIQYDYSFQKENATIVTMVKDNLWYYIKFQYDNEDIKKTHGDVFRSVLDSFQDGDK